MYKILLDMDGVLANFVSGAVTKLCKYDPYQYDHNLGVFEIEKLLKLTPEEFWTIDSLDFWENLDLMPDANEIVNKIALYTDLDNVAILTSPSLNEDCIKGKLRWIRKYFPIFNRRFIPTPAKEFLSGPNKVLIDDYDKNIDKFISSGGIGILVPRAWNSKYKYRHNAVNILEEQLKIIYQSS